MHYGFVGRAAGFPRSLLSSAAGAYQIFSGTSHFGWYQSYFDDPTDQIWINTGMNYWDYNSLSLNNGTSMFSIAGEDQSLRDISSILSTEDKQAIKEKFQQDYQEYMENR